MKIVVPVALSLFATLLALSISSIAMRYRDRLTVHLPDRIELADPTD